MNRTPLWTREAIEKAVGPKENLSPCGRGGELFTGISIDSRTVEAGDLFIALQGPAQNGHDYVAMAFEKGAVAALISHLPQGFVDPTDPRFLWVEDTEGALAALARAARARSQAKIVAVTGSVGKTGTKEALHHVLSGHGLTSSNVLSYNNQWGVPLSLARLPLEAAYGIFEIGMNHPGEIIPLTQLVRPHVALITTVVGAHQEFFASVEEIALAKAEIFQGVQPGGIAVLNRDNPYFALLCQKAQEAGIPHILSFGHHEAADIRLISATLDEAGSDIQAVVCGTPLSYRAAHPGQHWVANSLAVLATLTALDLPVASLADRLATLPALKGRGERHALTLNGKAITLIDESYNANPTSMEAALSVLGRLTPQAKGRRIAVLGDMRELGEGGPAAHRALKAVLDKNKVDGVLVCGPLMAQLYETLSATQQYACVTTAADLVVPLQNLLQEGDIVMVKGSKSMGLIPLVARLIQEGGRE